LNILKLYNAGIIMGMIIMALFIRTTASKDVKLRQLSTALHSRQQIKENACD